MCKKGSVSEMLKKRITQLEIQEPKTPDLERPREVPARAKRALLVTLERRDRAGELLPEQLPMLAKLQKEFTTNVVRGG
jgi:hypothetical protein